MMKKMIMAAVTLTMAVSLCGCAGIGRIEQAVRTADFEARTLLAGEETEVNTKNIQAESANRKKGTGKFRGLTFTASCEDAAAVRIQVENDSPDAYSFGWVEGSTLTCVTDEGEYYNTIPNCIVGAGGNTEFNCYFDNAQGEIQTIHISDMHMLNNGLPESFTPSTVDISFTGENSGTDGGESTSEEKNQAAAGSLQGTGNYQGSVTKTFQIRLAEGFTFKDKKSGGVYMVTAVTSAAKASVAFVKPISAKKTSITIPASLKLSKTTCTVTAIEANAFRSNKKIRKVIIGKNIASIGKNAFRGASKLERVQIKTKKLTSGKVGASAFKGIHKKAVFKLPSAKKNTYRKILLKKGAKSTMIFG